MIWRYGWDNWREAGHALAFWMVGGWWHLRHSLGMIWDSMAVIFMSQRLCIKGSTEGYDGALHSCNVKLRRYRTAIS